MAFNTCDPCCDPVAQARNNETFKLGVLLTLCTIAANTGGITPVAGVDTEQLSLCDPTTGAPVLLRYQFNDQTGAVLSAAAFLPDGTPYGGPIALLVSCSNTNPDPLIDTEFEVLCDPVTGDRVALRYRYDITTGALLGLTATLLDGTPYVGVINDLISCPLPVVTPVAPIIDGYVVTAPGVQAFVSPVKELSITDLSGSLLEVTLVGTGGAGNTVIHVPPNGSKQVALNKDTANLISSVSIAVLQGTGGDVLVDGFHPGNV